MSEEHNAPIDIIYHIDDKELEEKYINRHKYKMLERKFIEFEYKEAVKKMFEKGLIKY